MPGALLILIVIRQGPTLLAINLFSFSLSLGDGSI